MGIKSNEIALNIEQHIIEYNFDSIFQYLILTLNRVGSKYCVENYIFKFINMRSVGFDTTLRSIQLSVKFCQSSDQIGVKICTSSFLQLILLQNQDFVFYIIEKNIVTL